MNKIILLTFIMLSGISFGQAVRFDGICITSIDNKIESNSTLKFINDDLEVTLTPSTFWKINIFNKTNETTEINWNESYFVVANRTLGVIFNNDNLITAKQQKPNQIVASNSYIENEIFPKETLINGGVSVITGAAYKQGAPFIINLSYLKNNQKNNLEMTMDAKVCKKQK